MNTRRIGIDRPSTAIMIAAAALVVTGSIGLWMVFSGPSEEESVRVLCSLRDAPSEPLVDMEKSNTRDDLSAALRARSQELADVADRTSGDIERALDGYAGAMKDLADSVEADTSGQALGEAVERLSTDPAIAAAEKTLSDILDNRC